MTTQEVMLIKNSWRKLRNINAEIIGDLFYSKLFFDYPRLKKLFPASMQQQNKKLVDMLGFIVSRIEQFQQIKNDIEAMAVRHAGYGVKPEHYEMVGSALLWTLEKALAKDWNEQLKNAWFACFYLLSQTMIEATEREV